MANGPTRAAGYPSYDSTGTSKFIPQIWAPAYNEKFYASTILGQITNNKYEGSIRSKGDTIIIRTIPTLTIRDYEVGGGITYDTPESANIEMQIDKAKVWGAQCNDIDKVQSDVELMDEWAEDASKQMAIAIDTDVLANVPGDAATGNYGATAGVKSAAFNLGVAGSAVALVATGGTDDTNILNYLVNLRTVLDEQNSPDDRFVVLPPIICNMLMKGDAAQANEMGDNKSSVQNGWHNSMAGFDVYCSNLLSGTGTAGEFNILAGCKRAITFATQLTKLRVIDNPNDFGYLQSGLQVYGYKTTNPEQIAHGVVSAG